MLTPVTTAAMSIMLTMCALQKGKGKAAASQPLQPQLSQSAAEVDNADADGIQLKTDIAVTTELLEKFNAYSDTWEALEVGPYSLCGSMHAG